MVFLTQENLPTSSIWRAEVQELGGFALIDKDVGPTSFFVVKQLRYLAQMDRVGHAGTLDPLASGLLIVAFGKGTKQLQQFQGLPKGYAFTLKLGATTATDDAQMPEENVTDISSISRADVEAVVSKFIGTIAQAPPLYSAIKVEGQRAYDIARSNQVLELQPRPVMIHQLVITSCELPYVSFDMWCSKGTYVRSLARDIGAVFGCGAYITQLRRTGIGPYRVVDAVSIGQVRQLLG
jgi:tRNA pseudouridine55 synthase